MGRATLIDCVCACAEGENHSELIARDPGLCDANPSISEPLVLPGGAENEGLLTSHTDEAIFPPGPARLPAHVEELARFIAYHGSDWHGTKPSKFLEQWAERNKVGDLHLW